MDTTPRERLALGVAALLLVGGAGVRLLAPEPPAARWDASGEAAGSASIAELRERVEAEVEEEERSSTPLAGGEKIDPNRAPAAELERLPRVGPALAARIVAHREQHGPFRSLADLDEVSGFGPALMEAVGPHVSLSVLGSAGASAPTGARAPRLDVNRATVDELVALPGIGAVLAERIMEWRTTHGPFRSVADLEQVPGIGPKLLARLEPRLSAGP